MQRASSSRRSVRCIICSGRSICSSSFPSIAPGFGHCWRTPSPRNACKPGACGASGPKTDPLFCGGSALFFVRRSIEPVLTCHDYGWRTSADRGMLLPTSAKKRGNSCAERPAKQRGGVPMRSVTGLGVLGAAASLLLPAVSPAAEMRGITATEIKIGQTMPYSGPVSAFGALGKGEVGYFKMVNERGGINGRKVNLISLDDSYAPPKTVEQTRRLVESDEVAMIFSSIGTAP